jgi:two-component system, OmpR family, response regulator
MRVLQVEDDRMIEAAVTQALRDAACMVNWAMDGEAAIAAAEVESYDRVLLDPDPPGPDGRACVTSARFVDSSRSSSSPREGIDDRVEGLDLGADDYLIKPFETRERWRACPRLQAA